MVRNYIAVFRVAVSCALAALAAFAAAQPSVTTYHYDNLRTGLNSAETILKPANVTASKFGMLFSLPVDGAVYAQPLYMHNIPIYKKGYHNVVFIATEHNSVYAFDADSNTGTNSQPLWHVNFGQSLSSGDVGTGDISPEIGITGTPVIHTLRSGLPCIYVVSKTKTSDSHGNPIFTQKLHVLSVESGAEQLHGPIVISGQVVGVGDGSAGGIVAFNPLIQHNRPGLLIVPFTNADANLYVGFASHGDNGPYHGWIFVYDAETLKFLKILNTSPNALTDPSGYPLAAGGIWMGGCGIASDGTSIYFATGNGSYNLANGSYGDSIVRIPIKTHTFADYFTPAEQLTLDDYDTDLGSGGVMLLPQSASGSSKSRYLVQAGKSGTIYLLDTANLGKYNTTDHVHQELPGAVGGGIWGAPAFFNNWIFFGPQSSYLAAFQIKNGLFTQSTPTSTSPLPYGYPGPTPSVSSDGTADGIVWANQVDAWSNGGPAVLHAYSATNLADELYNSGSTNGRDTMGGAVKFTTPMVVNGKVYVGCFNEVDVFGLGTWAATPTVSPASGSYSNSVTVTLSDATKGAQIRYTTDGTVPNLTSPIYTKPLTVTTSTTFKARAFLGTKGGSAIVEADYLINAVTGTGTGLLGAYYNGTQVATGNPTGTEIDSTINFNWQGNSPFPGVGGSNWAGEWTGQIQALTTGSYTITTDSDDGVQVYINGNLVIDDYNDHGPTYDSATLNFVAGQKYTIDIKYYQDQGGSLLYLYWAAPGLPMQIVPSRQLYPVGP